MTEYKTIGRPSFFGKKRDSIQAGYDEKYGKDKWRLAHEINGIVYDFDTVIQLYEDAYYELLSSDGFQILRRLLIEASEVYDNAESNVDSGLDYHAQVVKDNINITKEHQIVLALKEYYNEGQGILNGSPRDIFADIHEILGGGNILPKWALEEWDDLNKKYGWTDKHTEIVIESEKRFLSHTKDQEVDI